MAKVIEDELVIEKDRGGRSPWRQWADGQAWLIDVRTDLPNAVTVNRAAATAYSWARRNGFALYYEFRSEHELLVRFRVTNATPGGFHLDENKLFELFMNTHADVTGESTDILDFPQIWAEWDKFRSNKDVIMSHGTANPKPRAMRLLRAPIRGWMANRPKLTDKPVVLTPVGSPTRLFGVRFREHPLAAPPTVAPTSAMEAIAKATEPTPRPEHERPAASSTKLPPSPFGSNQPEKAPPSPTAPKLTIDWPTLNALATTIDQLDDNEQDTTP